MKKFKTKPREHVKTLKVKKPEYSGDGNIKQTEEVIRTRHESEIISREANLVIADATHQVKSKKKQKEYKDKVYKDEDGKVITEMQMIKYQTAVADYYRKFVVLTDDQRAELRQKLPVKVNNLTVQVGSKAVFPHVLDTERKKISRGRIVAKMNRLKYIESDERRGLQLSEEDANDVFDKYKLQRAAKKDLVRTLLCLSYSDFEICEYLKIKGTELARLKKEIFYEEISSTRDMTNEELFAQYKMQQMEVVKDIDVLVERFKDTTQLNALASILKAKAEIFDKIIDKGQQFGVLEKSPEKHAFIGQLNVTDMSREDLEGHLQKTNLEIQKLMGQDGSFLKRKVKNVN